MNKNDLAVILGGRVVTNEAGEEAIVGLDERMLEIFDELLDGMRPDYEPSDEEMAVRIKDLVSDNGFDVRWGEYEGETFYVVEGWDVVGKLNEEYENRYNDKKDVMRWLDNWGFSDEYDFCDYNGGECGGVIRTSPNSYSWQPDYWETEYGERYCSDCMENNDLYGDYLEEKMNRTSLVNLNLVNPGAHGWTQLDFDFETGLYSGQRDDPKAVLALLQAVGIDVVFTASVGQFDVNWSVWVKDDQVEMATEALTEANTQLPYDPGTEMGKALRGEHSDVYTMRTYQITGEEFVKGDKIKEILEGKHD